MRRILWGAFWVVVAIWVIQNPASAASDVHSVFHALSSLASGIGGHSG